MVVGAYAPEPVGGSERQCALLTEALIARGHSVDVVTFRHTRATTSTEERESFCLHRLGRLGPSVFAFKRSLESLLSRFPFVSLDAARVFAFWIGLPGVWLARREFLEALKRFAAHAQGRYDLVHVHESGWLAGACVAQWQSSGVPVICKEATSPAMGAIGFDTPRRGQLDTSRRKASAWIAQTEVVRSELCGLLNSESTVALVPNAVAIPDDVAHSASTRVLYVGNLTQGAHWKGFDVLFDAWVQVVAQRSDAKLCVVGAGDTTPWTSVLARHAVEDSVMFAGRVPDPSSHYLDAGIFVLPSRVEGMSNALLEAQSFGLTCVVSDIPGNTAVVDHETNGITVPVGDADALAGALLRVLGDGPLRARLGEAARSNAERQFAVPRVVDALEQLYRGQVGA
jgi:glycosyltransferase involved in cell wall biosynthesis